jgi:phosphoglycolate phosphatase-like HAD superfamily hydrolase
MKYKAVIFDLDDTLLKTAVVKWAHHKAVAKQFYGIDLTDEVLAEHWGKPFEPMMAIFYQNADTPENMLKANLSLEGKYQKEVQKDGLNVVNALLAANVEVGVVTSILGHLARKDLSRLGFPVEKFFILQGADDAPAHKPDPTVFDAAFELLKGRGIASNEIVYVGDALMDYYASRDAGIDFIGVTTGSISQEQFKTEGAKTISSLGELLRIIKT